MGTEQEARKKDYDEESLFKHSENTDTPI